MDPNHFLHKKLPGLQKSEEVQDAVDKHNRLTGEKVPNSAEARLETYISRLEKIFLNEDEDTRNRNIEMLREKIHEVFVIKREDVPESYFDLQKRVAKERGEQVEEIPENVREQMITVIIEDQIKSLDSWIDYLSSNDAMYPTWFKYFVFRNITKLSQFDKELGKFKDRTKNTTAPFPDIYREALAQVSDLYESASRDKSLFQDKDFQTFLSKKFPTQYADKIQKTLEHSQEDREQIKGEWIKYSQGDNDGAHALYKSLESKGTGWCTAGSSTSQTQIKSGDFYVFYTYDKEGKPNQPRLAIRMNGTSTIGEVRGVLPHQEVEPLLQDTLDEKLSTFGNESDKYKKKSQDMKYLTKIEKATQDNKQLTRDDLHFLYELDSKIESFGYEEDPRIEEIKSKRNRKEDIQTLCNCPPEHIATDFININESTQVYCEDTGNKITFFDFREEINQKKLPQIIELAKSIKESGSPARPDMSFEGGIVNIDIDKEKLKDTKTALQSYKEADNNSPHYIWNEWINAPYTKPKLPLEAIILSYNKDTNTRDSSDKIVADMSKLNLRPATLEEMIALGIVKPEFNKRSGTYLVGLTKYSLDGVSRVPVLNWLGGRRFLDGNRWSFEWDGSIRFVCVRK
ncbi:hypothetical protein K9M47_01595 [Candidatus Gracilibacteria bacterium]|nr:hypothetical protein [Candidatus Gracilibacteria bacterium]